MKSMVVDDGVLEKEDMYILDRMKEFLTTEDVSRFAAARNLMVQIERSVRIAIFRTFVSAAHDNCSKHKEETSRCSSTHLSDLHHSPSPLGQAGDSNYWISIH